MIVYGKVELIGQAVEGEPLLMPLGSFQIPAGFPSSADEYNRGTSARILRVNKRQNRADAFAIPESEMTYIISS